jgi:peptidoglycan/LPS O-acetylase OafA/YrhL
MRFVRIMPSSGRRLAGIEGLRALAASSVLVYHAWLYSSPDGTPVGRGTFAAMPFETLALGVTLFFVLSGFLLYRPFAAAALEAGRWPNVRAYFRNRALRILPAYWVILAISGLVLQSTLVQHSGSLRTGALSDPGAFFSAALLVHDYRPTTMLIGIGPAWSLAVEAVFYVVLPLLGALALALAARARSARGLVLATLAPAALMLACGLSGKLAAATLVPGPPSSGWSPDWHSMLVRSFWAQADLFSFGMIVAVLHVQVKRGALRLPQRWGTVALATALPVGILAAVRLHLSGAQLSYVPENTVIAAVFAVLLMVVVLPGPSGGPSQLTRLLETRAVVVVGLISYSLFLWQEPLVTWLQVHGLTIGGVGGLVVNIVVLAALTAVLSVLTYRIVELPALRHKAPMLKPTGDREGVRRTAVDMAGLAVVPKHPRQ